MGILILESLTIDKTGVKNTETYCSFGKSTIKVKRDINNTINDTHKYIVHGIARLFYSMQDRLNGKTPIKEYYIDIPDTTLEQINDSNLYSLLYNKLKLENDFIGKTILDIPHITSNPELLNDISITEGLIINDSTNSNLIVNFDFGISHGISSNGILSENPNIIFEELHLPPDFLGLTGTGLTLDVGVSLGITNYARIISQDGVSSGITNRNVNFKLISQNPDISVTYSYIINPL